MQVARDIALPLILNAAIAYILLVTLPKAFEVDISISWVAVISGVFAIVWGLLRTGVVLQALRQTFKRQKKF
jgi:hypothetical protein